MITYAAHARTAITEREIDPAWVERTVVQPDIVEPDPSHPDRVRAFRAIPERDGRVLRVVYVQTGDDKRIITVFFDRGRRRSP